MTTVTLDRDDAPRAARRLVVAGCARAATGTQCAESAALMTSEVVTNAVRHGSGAITFTFRAGRAEVRVEVGDDDPRTPAPRAGTTDQESGRGMVLVEALASRWGVTPNPPGKLVWFEVPCQP